MASENNINKAGLEAYTGLRNRRTETQCAAEDEETPDANGVKTSGTKERGERSCQTLLKEEEFLTSKENSELEESSYNAEKDEDTDEKLSTKYKVEANNSPSNKPVPATSEDGDQTVQTEAANLRCPNHIRGCEWTGKKNDLDQHINKLPRNAQNEADGVEEVVEGCEYRLEVCPDCQKKVALKCMEAHLQEDPNHQVVPCELKHAGCNFECRRYQMAQHEESKMLYHLSLINKLAKEEMDNRLAKEERDNRLAEEERDNRLAEEERDNRLAEEERDNRLAKEERDKYDKWIFRLVIFALGLLLCYAGYQSCQLASLEGHLKLLQISLEELRNKTDLLEDAKKNLAFDLEGATSKLQQLRGEFIEVKSIFEELGFDIKNLKNGFSKKYIDDTIRALVCTFLPKSITSC